MGQADHDVYMLEGDPKTYIHTTDTHDGTQILLKELGFVHQYTVWSYGWSVVKGLIYPLNKYLDIDSKDNMLRILRINNGTDSKIRAMYKEVYIAEAVVRKRWWQYYRVKK